MSNDVEFFKRRDDVLADLLLAMGFRVSSSGMVEGFAQCMGDLGSADCTACLEEAVKQLKTLCGSVADADVFLAQCYARYWASGYYDYSGGSLPHALYSISHCSSLKNNDSHLKSFSFN